MFADRKKLWPYLVTDYLSKLSLSSSQSTCNFQRLRFKNYSYKVILFKTPGHGGC